MEILATRETMGIFTRTGWRHAYLDAVADIVALASETRENYELASRYGPYFNRIQSMPTLG